MEFKNVILDYIPKMSLSDLREIQNAIELSLNKDNVQEKAIQLIKDGRLLVAVKWVKDCTGMGLKDSKEYVDTLRNTLKLNGELE